MEENKKGRPTLFSEKTLELAKEYYFNSQEAKFVVKTRPVIVKSSDGSQHVEEEMYVEEEINFPSKEGLALYLGVHRDTLYEWCKVNEDFSDVFEKITALQGKRLVEGGLNNKHNPTVTKVMLTKHGYREGIEQSGTDGAPLNQNVADAINKVYGSDDQSSESSQG